MPRDITCTGCGNVLHVTEDVHLSWLTCPRCLTLVADPAPAPVAAPAVPTLEAVPVEAQPGTCPRCGKPVAAGFRFCPHCTAPLAQRADRPVRAVDAEVKGDLSLIGAAFILLGILGAIGVFIYLGSGALEHSQGWTPEGILLVWGVLLALPLVGIGFTLTTKRPEKSLVLGLGGGCTLALVAVGIPLAFVLAAIIAFLNTCGKCVQSNQPPRTTASQSQ